MDDIETEEKKQIIFQNFSKMSSFHSTFEVLVEDQDMDYIFMQRPVEKLV
jgi:hypothetical protein